MYFCHNKLKSDRPATDANGPELIELAAALQEFAVDSRLFESAITLSTEFDSPDAIGQLGHVEADLLGVKGITLLAVRPDGYIGLRSDKDHLRVLNRYQSVILEGCARVASKPEAR